MLSEVSSRDADADQPYDRAVTTPEIVRSIPLAEEILESHRHLARGDDAGYDAYKAHVYRVVNFARALTPDGPDRDDKLVIAAAFHDIAAFDTLDYLVPSIQAQDAWLQQTRREAWSDELALIVAEHPLDEASVQIRQRTNCVRRCFWRKPRGRFTCWCDPGDWQRPCRAT